MYGSIFLPNYRNTHGPRVPGPQTRLLTIQHVHTALEIDRTRATSMCGYTYQHNHGARTGGSRNANIPKHPDPVVPESLASSPEVREEIRDRCCMLVSKSRSVSAWNLTELRPSPRRCHCHGDGPSFYRALSCACRACVDAPSRGWLLRQLALPPAVRAISCSASGVA